MQKVFAKLFEAQKKIEAITKSEKNPFFKSNYFDINALVKEVKPTLNDIGLVVVQPLTSIDGKPALLTIVADPESGEEIREAIVLPENQDPQKMGAIITYYRRYALQSLLFLQAVDDDGNETAGHATKPVSVHKQKAATEGIEDLVPDHEPHYEQTQAPVASIKTCPKCGIQHGGKYPKCLECWKKDQPK